MEIFILFFLLLLLITISYDYKIRFKDRYSATLFIPKNCKNKIFLTFDDGPTHLTPKFLCKLDELGAKGIFFVIGRELKKAEHSATIHECVSTGHGIGNHSLNHFDSRIINPKELNEDIKATEKLISDFGAKSLGFRPPFGFWSGHLTRTHQILPVMWSHDSRDWDLQNNDNDKVIDSFAKRVIVDAQRQGAVLLFHDDVEVGLKFLDKLHEHKKMNEFLQWGTPLEFENEIKNAEVFYKAHPLKYYLYFRTTQILSFKLIFQKAA